MVGGLGIDLMPDDSGNEELVFLGDDLYINRQDEQELSELMRTDYPELSYRYFSAADMTTGQLFDSLKTIDRKTTGVLYSSWWYKKNFVGNTVLMTNAYRGITTFALPFFIASVGDQGFQRYRRRFRLQSRSVQ